MIVVKSFTIFGFFVDFGHQGGFEDFVEDEIEFIVFIGVFWDEVPFRSIPLKIAIIKTLLSRAVGRAGRLRF